MKNAGYQAAWNGDFMKKKSAVNRRSLCILALVLLASGLLVYWKYVFGNQLFVFNDIGSDTMQQYVMHYQTIINHVRDGNISFWDFNNGFGTNLFQLNLFDPTLDLLYLTGILTGTEHLLYYLVYLQIFRMILAGVFCYIFLSQFSYGDRSKMVAAYIYGLNGFMMVWGQHYQFGIALTYLPFLLYFLEKSLKTKKFYLPLCVMSCLQIVYSFYLGYMAFAAAGIYLIFRLCYLEGMTVREKLTMFAKRVGSMFLGIGMGAAALLPGAYVVFGISTRMEADGSFLQKLKAMFTPYPLQYYKTLVLKFFSGHLNGRNADYNGYMNYYEDPNVFFGTLFLIVLVQYVFLFCRKSQCRKKKIAGICAIVLSAVIYLLPLGGIAFNGFASYPTLRFTFVFMPFFALLTADVLERILVKKEISRIGLILSAVMIAGIYLYRLTAVEGTTFRVNVLALTVTGVLMAGVFWWCGTKRTLRFQNIPYYVLCVLVAVNMLCEGYTSAANRVTVEKNSSYFSELYLEDIQDALAWLRETDDSFYRVEKDFNSVTYCMDALAQDYRGISTYNSTMNGNLQYFLKTYFPEVLWANESHIRFCQYSWNPEFASLCGIKYLLSRDPDLTTPGYHRMEQQFGSIYIYQLDIMESFGKYFSATVTEEEFDSLLEEELPAVAMNRVLVLPEDEEQMNGEGTGSVSVQDTGNDSYLTGTVRCDSDGYVMLPVPYEGGWSVYVDGEETELVKADFGFMAFRVDAGDHSFELKFAPPLLKEGLIVSAVCWLAALLLALFVFLKSKNNSDNTRKDHKAQHAD